MLAIAIMVIPRLIRGSGTGAVTVDTSGSLRARRPVRVRDRGVSPAAKNDLTTVEVANEK